jgi:hypothetical protein
VISASGSGARARVAAAVTLAVGIAAAVVLTVGHEGRPGHGSGPRTSETRCLRTGSLDSVADLNAFVRAVRGDPAFAGGDVGASVRLQDGRRLFVFGDTLRSPTFAGERFVRNSMLVFSPGCGQVVLPADRGAVIPDRADGVGYWPMSIARVQHPGYDMVGISAQRVRSTGGPGVFAFEVLGPAAALFKVPRGGTPELQSVHDVGPDAAGTTRPMWGAAAVVDHGWVYLYGTSRPERATSGGFALRVARVRADALVDRRSWRYWDGRRWSGTARRARVLLPAADGVSQTLSVFREGTRWYAVSKRGEVLGHDLTIWTAPGPQGPFTASPEVVPIPSDAATGTLRYMPLAHPDLLPERGTVVVSYSENNTDYAVVRDDPRRYRPRFVRMRLPR